MSDGDRETEAAAEQQQETALVDGELVIAAFRRRLEQTIRDLNMPAH
jgi:hypothetical protein